MYYSKDAHEKSILKNIQQKGLIEKSLSTMRLHSNKEVIQYWRKNIRSKNDGSSEVPRKTDLTW